MVKTGTGPLSRATFDPSALDNIPYFCPYNCILLTLSYSLPTPVVSAVNHQTAVI